MDVNQNNLFPNFLVVGAAKCGTTSLYNYLKQHPDVYMSPVKEPNHFSTDIKPADFSPEYILTEKSKNLDIKKYVNSDMKEEIFGTYVHDPEDYKKLFRFAEGKKAIGEISNSYLYSSVASKNIKATSPEMKIIMILRNPAERAYSHYLANLRDGRTILSFREELEKDAKKKIKGWGISHVYYELGLYSEQVKRYLDSFDKDHLRIYFFDDLRKDPDSLIKNLFNFLSLNENVKVNSAEKHNEAKIPKSKRLIHFLSRTGLKRKIFRRLPKGIQNTVRESFFSKDPVPKLSTEDRKWLIDLYRDDILKLQEITGRNLSSWLNV